MTETIWDDDGLALSSRNLYLDARERAEAVSLSRELAGIAAGFRDGRRDLALIGDLAMRSLRARGWRPHYVAIRRRADLAAVAR